MQDLNNILDGSENLPTSFDNMGSNKINHAFPSNYSALPIQELRMRAEKLGIKNFDTLDKIMLIEEFIKLDQSTQ